METCVVVVLPLQLPVASLAPRVVVAPPPTVSVDLYLSRSAWYVEDYIRSGYSAFVSFCWRVVCTPALEPGPGPIQGAWSMQLRSFPTSAYFRWAPVFPL
eukprot:364569-Chlamydomonas_euryale.AAC.8